MSFKNFTNLYKRVERLSSAIFLVSNVILDSDELKGRIKSLAISLVSVCAELKDNFDSEKIKMVSKAESILLELASLLDIASVSGLISAMNASILKLEFDQVIKDLTLLREYHYGKSDINKSFFGDNNIAIPSQMFSVGSDEKLLNSPEVKEKIATNSRREHREKAILELIKAKRKVNIKDISRSIKGCSEKTIQRKLASLIALGIVKKEGERRWSRYSLAG